MQYENESEIVTDELNNQVVLTGTVSQLELYKGNTEEQTHHFMLSVNRLSGIKDMIPIAISAELSGPDLLFEGNAITVKGKFTSFNKIVGDRSKLILNVRANEISAATDEDTNNPNTIELVGYICKAPIYRTTPFNREIADLLLAVNRSATKSDYIPAIAWGRNARLAKNLLVGDKVQLSGRIQSREYQKRLADDSQEIRTAYEVSINSISRID